MQSINVWGHVVNFLNVQLLRQLELRIDRKLQEANIDWSEGDDRLQASRLRL